MSNDLVNGLFETVSAFLVVLSIRKLHDDKEIKGVDWRSSAFFVVWGAWNLHYYPTLNQWFSFVGGVLLCSANFTWVVMVGYYWLQRRAVRLDLQPITIPETGVQS